MNYKLEDNSILIVDNKNKNKIILRYRNELKKVKIITFNEFKNKYTFSYDNRTIYYMMKKYGYKYEVCLVYLDNLYYINNKNYSNNKLQFLKNLKDELDEQKLLIYNNLFKRFICSKKIYVYTNKTVSKFYKNLFSELNVTYIKNEKTENRNFDIYEFNDMNSEINFVARQITTLIKSGVNISKIKLMNVKEEYNYTINKIFKFYNIPIYFKNTSSLYSTSIGKYFLDNLSSDKKISIEKVASKFKNNIDEINLLIKVLNNYTWCDNLMDVKELLVNDLKNTFVIEKRLKNEIEIIDFDEIVDEEEYVFLIGFNQGIIPKLYKDEEYITDNIKNEIDVETTLEKNNISKNDTLELINNIKNIFITYKTHNGSLSYSISNISEEMNYNLIKDYKDEYNMSNLYNKILLSNCLDVYSKYGEISECLPLLLNNYNDINYLTYDNTFKGVDKNKLETKLSLSYSSIDNYYRCSFRYYVENILKLSIYEETFMTFVGKLYHYILSIMDEEDFDLHYSYKKYIEMSNKDFSEKERFFLDKLEEEIEFVIKTIKEQLTFTKLSESKKENRITINKNEDLTFVGIVDKIMYEKVLNKTVIEIIDYKTGNPEINLNNLVYGIGMQLPIYIYLVSKSNDFKNIKIGGFYLQKVLQTVINKDQNNSYETLKRNNLKLQGYSNSDTSILELVDSSYNDSKVIKGLRTSSKGFYAYSKVLNDEQIDFIIDTVDNKIDEAYKKIKNGEFDINPKRIGGINKGCEFCKYKDLCFMKENDIVNLKEVKFGGEDE